MEKNSKTIFTDNVYLESPRESIRKQIQTLKEFSKVTGYNISIIISTDIEKIPFITATKKIKYLIRNKQNLYEKVFKALLERHRSRWTNGQTLLVLG